MPVPGEWNKKGVLLAQHALGPESGSLADLVDGLATELEEVKKAPHKTIGGASVEVVLQQRQDKSEPRENLINSAHFEELFDAFLDSPISGLSCKTILSNELAIAQR